MRIQRTVEDTLVLGNINLSITESNTPEPSPNYRMKLVDFSGSREQEFVIYCKSLSDLQRVRRVFNEIVDEIIKEATHEVPAADAPADPSVQPDGTGDGERQPA